MKRGNDPWKWHQNLSGPQEKRQYIRHEDMVTIMASEVTEAANATEASSAKMDELRAALAAKEEEFSVEQAALQEKASVLSDELDERQTSLDAEIVAKEQLEQSAKDLRDELTTTKDALNKTKDELTEELTRVITCREELKHTLAKQKRLKAAEKALSTSYSKGMIYRTPSSMVRRPC